MQPKITVFDSTQRNEYIYYMFDISPSAVKTLKELAKKEYNTFSGLTSIVVYLTQKISSTQVKCSINLFIETTTFGHLEETCIFVNGTFTKATKIDSNFRERYSQFVDKSEELNQIPFVLGDFEFETLYEPALDL